MRHLFATALLALMLVPALRAAEMGVTKWRVVPPGGDEGLDDAVIQLRAEAARNMAEFEEQVRILKLDFVRGLITARQFHEGVDRITVMAEHFQEDFMQRLNQLKQQLAARDARRKAATASQPRKLNENERAILKLFDRAVTEGKVPAKAVVDARQIILSGHRDAKSVAFVKVVCFVCLAELADNEKERAEYGRVAEEARVEYLKLLEHEDSSPQR